MLTSSEPGLFSGPVVQAQSIRANDCHLRVHQVFNKDQGFRARIFCLKLSILVDLNFFLFNKILAISELKIACIKKTFFTNADGMTGLVLTKVLSE